MTPREPLDSLIDNTASRLTHAKPSDALRANVMARIASERPSRFPWRFVFAGGAVAAIAVVSVISFRSPDKTIGDTPISNNPIISASKPPTPDPTGAAAPSSPSTSTVMRTAALANDQRQTFHALNAAEQAWLERGVPALEDPKAPEVPATRIAAIDIEPLRVAPLVVPALGDEQHR